MQVTPQCFPGFRSGRNGVEEYTGQVGAKDRAEIWAVPGRFGEDLGFGREVKPFDEGAKEEAEE